MDGSVLVEELQVVAHQHAGASVHWLRIEAEASTLVLLQHPLLVAAATVVAAVVFAAAVVAVVVVVTTAIAVVVKHS